MIGCDCAVCRSGDPRNKRTRASALIRAAGKTLLIDATTDLRQQVLRHGIKRLDAILLTHSHADHILGLDDVRAFSAWQEAPIPVYGDAETLKVVRRNLDYVFRDSGQPLRWDIPRLELFEMNGCAEVCGVAVTPVPVLHGRRSILAFRIGGLAYVTDCSGVPEPSVPLLSEADTLVVGAIRHEPHPAHFTLAQAVELVARLKPRRAYVTHISHRLDHEPTEATLPADVRLAYDGLDIEVPG